MRLTSLGHACLLLEVGDVRLLVDPGAYSSYDDSLTGLDAVFVTHQHADHVDRDRLPGLLAANPAAELRAEPETAGLLTEDALPIRPTAFARGDAASFGPVTVEGVGDRHAFNHDGVPGCGNTGLVISAPGEPTLFHPGDAYDVVPDRPVDVLALPLSAPWCAVRDTIAFARRIGARWAVPVHDGLLNQTGRDLYLMHVGRHGGSEIRDLADGGPWSVG